ncbi:MAG: alginate O-acetyltransferase AlgX-related protein [Armatimonadota bacterium]
MTEKQPYVPLYEPNSREEEAELSLKYTKFSKGVQIFFVVILLLTIVSESSVQMIADITASRAYQADSEKVPERKLFRWVEFWQLGPSMEQIKSARSFWDYWGLLPQVSKIKEYETGLEDDSIIGQALRPKAQQFLTNVLGAGNEQVFVGRDGWLYYRPEVEYLTGRGFLTAGEQLKRLRSGTEAVQPDPIKAIVQFHKYLAERGITLVVMPVACKPMTMSEMLAWPATTPEQPLQNDSYAQFEQKLTDAGVRVMDTTRLFWDMKTGSAPQPTHLRTDTHWTPQTMQSTASVLAAYIKVNNLLGKYPSVAYRTKPIKVKGEGDISLMLKLDDGGKSFPRQEVELSQVLNPDGSLWSPNRQSPILLMGDSYSNIYSLGTMGWGESAGFGEHLSERLNCPVDMIVINAGGSYASRQQLMKEMSRGDDRLAGKRVVVYEFAMRDLSSGDWKLFDLPKPKHAPQPTVVPETPVPAAVPAAVSPAAAVETPLVKAKNPVTPQKQPEQVQTKPVQQKSNSIRKPETVSSTMRVQAVVKAISAVPKPGSVPYKDCLIALELSDIKALSGNLKAKTIVVFAYGMKDNRLVSAGEIKAGARVTLELQPWSQVEAQYGGLNRVELDDPDAIMLDTYWGVLK